MWVVPVLKSSEMEKKLISTNFTAPISCSPQVTLVERMAVADLHLPSFIVKEGIKMKSDPVH